MNDLTQLVTDYRRMLSNAKSETERQHWQDKINVLTKSQKIILELEKEVTSLKRRMALKRN